MPQPKILCVVGPTACGKTKMGVLLARRYGGEVVSVDSMQIYRGMTIGTAAPTPEETEGVPHHMVAVADPAESWSVARFTEEADRCVRDILRRGKLPDRAGRWRIALPSWEKMPVHMSVVPYPQQFIIQLVRLKGVVDRFCGQRHFLKKFIPESRLQEMQLSGVFLAQKKGIAGETLIIADHHVAGFQFSDKIRILSLPGLLDPPADAAVGCSLIMYLYPRIFMRNMVHGK